MDIVAVIVLLFLFLMLFSTNSPGWGWGWTRFNGANVLWTILVILVIIWLARRIL